MIREKADKTESKYRGQALNKAKGLNLICRAVGTCCQLLYFFPLVLALQSELFLGGGRTEPDSLSISQIHYQTLQLVRPG